MLRAEKIVGLNSDFEVALSHIFQKQVSNSSGKQLDIRLFFLTKVSGEEAFVKTRQLLPLLEESFYLDETRSIPERLSALQEIIKQNLPEVDKLEFVVAATIKEDLLDRVLYVLRFGTSLKIFLTKINQSSNLSEMTPEGQLLSGFIHPGDRIVLATEDFLPLFKNGLEEIRQIPLEEIEDATLELLPKGEIHPITAIIIEESSEENNEVPVAQWMETQPKTEKVFSGMQKFPTVLADTLIPASKPKKIIPIIVAILLIICGGGYLGFKKYKAEKNKEIQISNLIKAATISINKTNNKAESKAQALSDLKNAQKLLTQIAVIDPKNSQAQELKSEINQKFPQILKIYQVNNFPLWLDLSLLKPNFEAQQMSLSHGNLLLLDPTHGDLISVDLATKSPQILAGKDKLGDASLASLNGSTAWVYSQQKGLLNIDLGNDQISNPIKLDKDWGGIVNMVGFANNIYLLDELKNQIWKYVPVADGYSDKIGYLNGVTDQFLGSKKMQIDSSIWVLKANGGIDKFTEGGSDFFSYQGLDKDVNHPVSFFVSENGDNVYILDSGNSRLLIVDKKGVYQSQYRGDKFATFTDLAVDEDNKKIYLLKGSKIFRIDLQ